MMELRPKYEPSGSVAIDEMKHLIEQRNEAIKFKLLRSKWGFEYDQKMYKWYREVAIKHGEDVSDLPEELEFEPK